MRCMRCGLCQATCPVYQVQGVESSCARGQVSMIRAISEGRLKNGDGHNSKLGLCLSCGACAAACPSGVAGDEVVMAMRAHLRGQGQGSRLGKFLFDDLLTKRRRLRNATFPMRFYQHTGLQWLARRSGLLQRLPRPLAELESLMPGMLSTPMSHRLPRVIPAQGKRRFRVAYFLGCVSDLCFGETTAAVVNVLTANGCEVAVPEVECCGMPHRAYGETEPELRLAAHNAAVLEATRADAIVVDCATCGSTLQGYARLLGHTTNAGLARRVSRKVMDISAWLNQLGVTPPTGGAELRVTYHDPCHLVRGQGVKQQPRDLLKQIPGVEFVEMAESDWCCGGAGSYQMRHYDISRAILDRKIAHIRETGAQVVASGCPSCLIQLRHGIKQSGLDVQAVHPVELLAQRVKGER